MEYLSRVAQPPLIAKDMFIYGIHFDRSHRRDKLLRQRSILLGRLRITPKVRRA
jgi:hypothetical protein